MGSAKRSLKILKTAAFGCALASLATIFTGCGGSFFVDPTVTGVKVAPATPFVQSGRTQQMAATAIYSDGSTKNITGSATWTSSNSKVATVNSAGVVSGLISGSATITVSNGTVSGSTLVTVSAAPLTSIEVTPLSASVTSGQELRFSARGTFQGGQTQDITSRVTWTSTDSNVATIKGGLATAQRVYVVSQVQIYAASGNIVSQPVTLVVYPY
jgi:uncharacterized protein YjdB